MLRALCVMFRALYVMFFVIGLIIAFGAVLAIGVIIRYRLTIGPQSEEQWHSFVGSMLRFNAFVTVAAAASAIATGVIGFRRPTMRALLIYLGALNIFIMPIGMIFANIVFRVHLDWRLLNILPDITFMVLIIACVSIPILFLICVIARLIAEGKQ